MAMMSYCLKISLHTILLLLVADSVLATLGKLRDEGQVSKGSKYRYSSSGCVEVDDVCVAPYDLANYEAIRALHSQLDDDMSGDIDVAESVEFLKEELKYEKGFEKRQEIFHSNNDKHISVRDLWEAWQQSEVHNWTVEQTVVWLVEAVELKQYAQHFYENAINGSILPRLAANNEQFLTKVLGIKDVTHRTKIAIKAMDVVLFGPPKEAGSYIKDLIFITLLTLAILGCLKIYQSNRQYEAQLITMTKHMEELKEEEEKLRTLEIHLNKSKSDENKNDETIKELQEELERTRDALNEKQLVEEELEDRHWTAPLDLQYWLQITFEREKLSFEQKQLAARKQFQQAKDLCEKLNRQRRSFMGVLASVHGKMDSVDQSISQAKNIMDEVTQELTEREERWRNIERLAGCPIITNMGLHGLELMLRPQVNGRPHSTYAPSIGPSTRSARLSSSMDDFDDDCRSIYTLSGLTGSLGGSMGTGTPQESMMDIHSSSGSTKRRNQFTSRDSGSSLGSDSTSGATSSSLPHSRTFPGPNGGQIDPIEEGIKRSSSTGSVGRVSLNQLSKESNESSNDEADNVINFVKHPSKSLMKTSPDVLTMENSLSPPQVSPAESSKPKPSARRSPMLKSYSHDVASSQGDLEGLQANESISVSEPALAAKGVNRTKTGASTEDEYSTDSSDRNGGSSKKKKKSILHTISGSLRLSSKKKQS